MDDGRVPVVSKAGLYCSGVSALCWGVSVLKRFEAAKIEAAKPIISLSGDSCGTQPLCSATKIDCLTLRSTRAPMHVICADLRSFTDAVPLVVRVSGQAWSADPLQCELLPSREAVITDVRHTLQSGSWAA